MMRNVLSTLSKPGEIEHQRMCLDQQTVNDTVEAQLADNRQHGQGYG